MGNWASRLGCLGERRSGLRAGSKAQEDSSPSADLQGLHPPGVSWAWWGTRAIQVTEVTETVVTETVVTEAVEVGPGQQGKQLTEVPPELLNTLQSWLDGMEELQASQGPLAADAVVAAAQLQEQEVQGMGNSVRWHHLILSLRSSHQHTMLPRQKQDHNRFPGGGLNVEIPVHVLMANDPEGGRDGRMGHELPEQCPASNLMSPKLLQHLLEERAPQVEPRLQEVGSPAKLCAQWHHLVQWAETRLRLLQQVVPAAQSFDAARETLLARLGPGEQLLVELEEGQLGPKGQERVMQCLQHVCEEATACAKDLGRALETGQRLAELLAEDEARLVNQQLEGLRECVKLTVSGAARVWQMLLCAQKIGSCELLPPTGLEAQLDLEEVTSEGPGLKDQEEVCIPLPPIPRRGPYHPLPTLGVAVLHPGERGCLRVHPQGLSVPSWDAWNNACLFPQLSVQLAQLAEWLEQLASQVEVPGQEATSMVPIQEQCLPPSTLGPSMVQPGLEFSWGQQTLAVSWPWRGPAWRGGINFEGTCHLSLLMNLPGSQAAMFCPPRERSLNLEGTLLIIGHLLEELLTCPHGLNQAEPLRTKVGPMTRNSHLHSYFMEQPRVSIMHCSQVAHAQGWRMKVLPAVLGDDRLKPWTPAPVQVLAQRDPDQAGLPGVSLEELSWRLPWAEATKGSWNHRNPETRERNWRDKDHLEQDLTDNVLASGEQGEDGLGCLATYGGHETTSQRITMLGSELPNSQQPLPHSMARAGDTGTGCQRWVHGPGSLGEQVARGTLMVRVGGGWVALDEFLVKNDPDRAKGRTSHKIHERFQCWARAQKSRRVKNIITLSLWASIPSASSRPLPRKTELPTCSAYRNPQPFQGQGH